MGGKQSTRKIGIDNNESVGVIRVSENVAQRLKSVNNGEEVEKELEKNDRYWERKIKSLQDNQNKITSILKAEFDKACKEVESSFPSLAPKDAAVPCQEYKSEIVDCLKNNANHTLNCSPIVEKFTSCVNNSKSRPQSEHRSL